MKSVYYCIVKMNKRTMDTSSTDSYRISLNPTTSTILYNPYNLRSHSLENVRRGYNPPRPYLRELSKRPQFPYLRTIRRINTGE